MKSNFFPAWGLCVATLVMVTTGCAPQKPPAQAGIPGVYTLVSIDGNAVPASLEHQGAKLEVRSGSFTLNRDGTCGTKTVFVPPNGKEMTREVNATYTSDDGGLTMKWQGAGVTSGKIAGNTFTMNNEGMVFVYRRQ